MTEKKLYIAIDSCNYGGAEFYLLWMLKIFKQQSFNIQEIYYIDANALLLKDMSKYFPLKKISILSIFCKIFFCRSQDIFWLHLSKMIFSGLLAQLLRYLLFVNTANVTIHIHTMFDYFKHRKGVRRLFDFFYKKLILFCVRKNLVKIIFITYGQAEEIKYLLGKNDLSKSIFTIHNSIPLEKIERIVASRGNYVLEKDSLKFFTFSRLSEEKNINWAIDAVIKIALKNIDKSVSLKICGLGPQLDNLKDYVSKNAGSKNLTIEFCGFINDIGDLLRISDVFLFPSASEGFGLSLLEAAISGITCIATNSGYGVSEMAVIFQNIKLINKPFFRDDFINKTEKYIMEHKTQEYPLNQLQTVNWPNLESQVSSIHEILFRAI